MKCVSTKEGRAVWRQYHWPVIMIWQTHRSFVLLPDMMLIGIVMAIALACNDAWAWWQRILYALLGLGGVAAFAFGMAYLCIRYCVYKGWDRDFAQRALEQHRLGFIVFDEQELEALEKWT